MNKREQLELPHMTPLVKLFDAAEQAGNGLADMIEARVDRRGSSFKEVQGVLDAWDEAITKLAKGLEQ